VQAPRKAIPPAAKTKGEGETGVSLREGLPVDEGPKESESREPDELRTNVIGEINSEEENCWRGGDGRGHESLDQGTTPRFGRGFW